jgi:mannosylglycerate hydrolase MGH1-like protein
MHRMGSFHEGLWDEEDGFFYDLLRLPDGSATRLKTRSLVGLLPLCATVVLEREMIDRFPVLMERIDAFARRFPSLVQAVEMPDRPGLRGRRLLTVMNEAKLRRVLARMLDPDEFLSDYGIRSLSKWHRDHPYRFDTGSAEFRVAYEPAESSSGLFGGNSNWRGPVWFPANALLIRALRQLYLFYGDEFTVECPSGSGVNLTLYQVSEEIAKRLAGIFRRDSEGHRPVFGGTTKFQDDPHWRDCLLFYEYFNGDDGAGLGASHQTGWTGLVATAMVLYGDADVAQFLEQGAQAAVATLAGRDRP